MSNIQNKLRIKFVSNDLKNSNKQKSNTYKIAFKNNNVFEKKEVKEVKEDFKFKVNDKVIHNEEKIIGKISFVGNDKITVIWSDHTRERFPMSQINELSIYNDENQVTLKEETEEILIETRKVSNTPKIESTPVLSEIDKLYNQAFSEMDDEYDDIIDANPNKLKEQMIKRQVDMMEQKIENKQISDIKKQSVEELISLMKDKNMITDDETEEIKRQEILLMSDPQFERFKKQVISGKVTLEPELSEAEKMLQRIKFGGPVIGDFSKSPSSYSGSNETRSLSGGQTRSLETVASKNESFNNGLNLDGFRDLQGLTKPLQVVSEQKSPRQNISDAISSLDWTTLSKMF